MIIITNRTELGRIRIHLTNVTGLGASKLLLSLLPSLERSKRAKVVEIHLPNKGVLSKYIPCESQTELVVYDRILPNALSRLAECLFPSVLFDDEIPVLVLGDLPLRCKGPQVVFVQNSHLVKPKIVVLTRTSFKYFVSRMVFRINLSRLKAVIVQTSVMRERLIYSYPSLIDKVYVIPQPVPVWIADANVQRMDRVYSSNSMLSLFYPAACYPHKNHKLLAGINALDRYWPISKLTLTIDVSKNPTPAIEWISCLGELGHKDMLEVYRDSDALLFLSKEESFGFPLVEAMYLGLPIVCSDLPFARTLCGDGAVYFDPDDITSLNEAILDLKKRLMDGWRPNWENQLQRIPQDWQATADEMINLCV